MKKMIRSSSILSSIRAEMLASQPILLIITPLSKMEITAKIRTMAAKFYPLVVAGLAANPGLQVEDISLPLIVSSNSTKMIKVSLTTGAVPSMDQVYPPGLSFLL